MSDTQKFVKYGDRTMPLEPGMTLEQVKELMARHFPELADPKVETKKDEQAGKVTYVFSKKAGHKGARSDIAVVSARLNALIAAPIIPGELRDLDHALEQLEDYDLQKLGDELSARVQAVQTVCLAVTAMPTNAPKTGSVL